MSKNSIVSFEEKDFAIYQRDVMVYQFVKNRISAKNEKMFQRLEEISQKVVSNFGVWMNEEDRDQIYLEFEKIADKTITEEFSK